MFFGSLWLGIRAFVLILASFQLKDLWDGTIGAVNTVGQWLGLTEPETNTRQAGFATGYLLAGGLLIWVFWRTFK